MNNSIIKIESRQKSIDTGETLVETFDYEGVSGRVGNTICIGYNQIDDESGEIVKNLIKIEGGKVTRTSSGVQTSTMVFESGKTTKTTYKTAYGEFDMSFFAKNVQIFQRKTGMEIILEYTLSINKQPTTETMMRIHCTEKE